MGPSGMQLALRHFLLCQTAWQAAKGFKSCWAVQPAAPSPAQLQSGGEAAGRRTLFPSPADIHISEQRPKRCAEALNIRGQLLHPDQNREQSVQGFGKQLPVLSEHDPMDNPVTPLLEEQIMSASQPNGLSRSWINGLKQLLWNC